MVRRATSLGTCALLLLISISGCIVKKANNDTPPQKASVDTVSVSFTPPADSLITLTQMRSWLTCNNLLDSLSYLFRDSFQTENSALRLHYQQAFIDAQNAICLRCGLAGGYSEYLWILKNAGAPRNRRMLDSVGLASY